SVDLKTEKRASEKYKVDIATGKSTELTESDYAVFQRNNGVSYALKAKKVYQSKDEKNWTFLADLETGAENISVAPNGKCMAYSKPVHVENILSKDIYSDLPNSTGQVYHDLNYRHWDEWKSGTYNHVFVANFENGDVIDLLFGKKYDCPQAPFGGQEDIVWSPDGTELLYVCKKKEGKDYAQSTNTDIYAYNVADGSTRNLTEGMMGYDTQPAFWGNGNYLAFLSMKRDGYEADKHVIVVKDWNKKKLVSKLNLTAHWDETVNSFLWSEDGK